MVSTMTESDVENIIHAAATVWIDTEDPDIRLGALHVVAELVMPDIDRDHALVILKHAVNGVY